MTHRKDASLIVCGDARTGKSTLLSRFDHVVPDASPVSSGAVMEYGYVHVKTSDDDADDRSGCVNVWQLGDPAHAELLPLILASSIDHLERVAYLVVVDLSQPHRASATLDQWLGVITQQHQAVLATRPVEQREQLRRNGVCV